MWYRCSFFQVVPTASIFYHFVLEKKIAQSLSKRGKTLVRNGMNYKLEE